MNRCAALVFVGLFGCSLSIDKDFVFVSLVAPGGPSPAVDEVRVIVEGSSEPVSFLIDPAQAVPLSGEGALFSFVLDFPREERGAQVGVEVIGVFEGQELFFGATRATVGRDVETPVEIAVSFCGNAVVEDLRGEACDDGNRANNDGCSAACAIEVCGDGVKQTSEQCDDGNVAEEDGCDQFCVIEECGDGIVQAGLSEACDDGNGVEGDSCDTNCTLPACGNGIVDPNQFCYDDPVEVPLGIVGAINNMAAGDLDGDGDSDLVVLEAGATNKALLVLNNNGQLILDNFLPLAAAPEQVIITDIVGDSGNDIVVQTNTVLIFENQGPAGFIQVVNFNAGGINSTEELDGLQVRDIDGDGDKDIAAIQLNDKIKIIKNDGNNIFSLSQTITTAVRNTSIRLVDIDKDQDFDLIATIDAPNEVRTFTNNAGTFTPKQTITIPTSSIEPRWIVDGDFDQDTDQDLIISSFGGTSVVRLINDGTGIFSQIALLINSGADALFALATSDFNNDNDIDFLVSDIINNTVRIFDNKGTNNFQQISTFNILASDSLIIDINNDQTDEIIVDSSNKIFIISSKP